MTYIELINRFWELDESWQFSCCETRLYFYLLKIANRLGWEDNWTRSDTKVSSDVGVSVKVFKSARNRLVQAGLIECKQGNGRGNKSTYSIKGVQKGMQNIPPLGHPLGTPFQESSPIPPKEEYKTETKTKKEPPKGGKKESSSGELFPPSKPEKPKRVAKEFILLHKVHDKMSCSNLRSGHSRTLQVQWRNRFLQWQLQMLLQVTESPESIHSSK